MRSEVDVATLVPDPTKTIAEGAVKPWNSGGRRLSMYAAGELGVRLDVPFESLTDHEVDIVLHGEPVKREVTLSTGRSGRKSRTVRLSVNYDNAVAAAQRSLGSDKERSRRLAQRLVATHTCSVCHGTRLRPEALASLLSGCNLAQISAMGLDQLPGFIAGLPEGLPAELGRMTTGLLAELNATLAPLLDVGLGYLTLDRPGATLSTGERQRIELGPAAGVHGGEVIAQGSPRDVEADPRSVIGPFLAGSCAVPDERLPRSATDAQVTIEVADLLALHDVTAGFPVRRLTGVAGPSGAGKTALVLDSLIPAAHALLAGAALPGHVRRLDLAGIRQVVQVDASPIGQNARSTAATYCGAFDHIRRLFAQSPQARRRRWEPGHFSFNTREGQCPTCRGLGDIDLDVQYLPDITVACPTCHGARFNNATLAVSVDGMTIADVLGLSVTDALERLADHGPVTAALRPVSEVGLGYLRLGESTPSLSGGESQRLQIATRLRSSQRGALYVFDEPSTGLHPVDVATLVGVFDRLLQAGATVAGRAHGPASSVAGLRNGLISARLRHRRGVRVTCRPGYGRRDTSHGCRARRRWRCFGTCGAGRRSSSPDLLVRERPGPRAFPTEGYARALIRLDLPGEGDEEVSRRPQSWRQFTASIRANAPIS